MTIAHLDFETRSRADLKKTGADRYARDPSTEIVCASYRFDDGPTQRWKAGEKFPANLLDHVSSMRTVVAHNAAFERAIWNHVLPKYAPDRLKLFPEQQVCTMARAYALALPPSLDGVGTALELPITKDLAGHRLMMKMCKPKADGTWHEPPEDVERLQAYCDQDVAVECLVDKTLPPLSQSEQKLWVLDQRINDRGVLIDVETVHRALAVVDVASKQADRKMWVVTDGAVKRITETAKLVAWLNSRGIECESVAKGETDELVAAATLYDDAVAMDALDLRREAKSSTAKFSAMANAAAVDGRVRGSLQYHGASTGRWAGRLIQPQNFPRVDADRDGWKVEAALALLNSDLSPADICDNIRVYTHTEPMAVLSKCLRAMIVAPEGHDLIGGDFSNIEGRINAWLAGEEWKVQAFRNYDAGSGPDLYRLSYARAFGMEPGDVDVQQRQIGKTMELAMGYQGGVGAFQTMARGMGVAVTDDRADELKIAWREAHPAIVKSWWAVSDAAIAAVGSPGMVVPCLSNRVAYVVANGFLFCRLPSLRVLAYAAPRLIRNRFDQFQVEFDGVDSVTKRWGPQTTYGGKLIENIVQGIARDVMAEGMVRLDAHGDYPITLTVHDEVLCETPEGRGSVEEFKAILAQVPGWAAGLPCAVSAWRDKRYVK